MKATKSETTKKPKRDMSRVCYAYLDRQNLKAVKARSKEWGVSFSFIMNQLAKKFTVSPYKMFGGATLSQIKALAAESKGLRKKM
jgi:hypothetical protein